jgi:hypothetical protein
MINSLSFLLFIYLKTKGMETKQQGTLQMRHSATDFFPPTERPPDI